MKKSPQVVTVTMTAICREPDASAVATSYHKWFCTHERNLVRTGGDTRPCGLGLGVRVSKPRRMAEWMKETLLCGAPRRRRKTGSTRATRQDRLLAALRRAEKILDSEYPAQDERHPGRWGLTELIHELETANKDNP
jgi:hypothetical protein